jgi:hypothetical protein
VSYVTAWRVLSSIGCLEMYSLVSQPDDSTNMLERDIRPPH